MLLSELDRVPHDDVLWSARQAQAFLGLKNSAFYELADEPDFPAKVRVGRRTVRWFRSEIVAYVNARREKRMRADVA